MSDQRRITIVGAGTVGRHLAAAFATAGHDVRLAARNPASDKVVRVVDELGLDVVELAAAADADVVVLAVPFGAVSDTVTALGELGETILVDATNTVGDALPSGASTIADVIAASNPDAIIVKAFNTIGAEAITVAEIDGHRLFLPIAGDDAGVETVRALADDIGFDAVVVGGRAQIHLLENFAELWIHLAFNSGFGRSFGFTRLTQATAPPT